MKVVIAGATGLVGRSLVDAFLARGVHVTALARRDVEVPHVTTHLVDFLTIDAADVPSGTDAALCCLGTTIRSAGSEAAFRDVDHGHVMRFARACFEAGVPQFHVVSALGASDSSRVFYNRVKGEMERDVQSVGFSVARAYRPSLLLGARAESRPGERAGAVFSRVVGPIVPRRWRAIPAEVVARAMVAEALAPTSASWRVVDNAEMWTSGRAFVRSVPA